MAKIDDAIRVLQEFAQKVGRDITVTATKGGGVRIVGADVPVTSRNGTTHWGEASEDAWVRFADLSNPLDPPSRAVSDLILPTR